MKESQKQEVQKKIEELKEEWESCDYQIFINEELKKEIESEIKKLTESMDNEEYNGKGTK